MSFEKEIWSKGTFQVLDNRLFDHWPDSIPKPTKFYVSAKFVTYYTQIDYVCGFTTGGWLTGCDPTQAHCFDVVDVICSVGWTYSGWESDDGDDGTNGTWSTSPDGSGGGPTGGNNTPSSNQPPNQLPDPCNSGRTWFRIVLDPATGVWKNPCTGEPIPPPTTPDNPDDNGFYPSRIQELSSYIHQDGFSITPCDEIAAIGTYGSMWQDIATYIPPRSVRDRLTSIRDQQPQWIVDDYNIESLYDASGDVINLDFFPIQITQLPLKPNGVRYTAREFLEFFRHNLNPLITPPVDVNFSCTFTWFDDCAQWNSNYEASLGALCSVHLGGGPGGTYNSGSIILSDYHGGVNPNGTESYWFTVSTLETPFDGEHPVAGNRRWGMYNTIQNPDQWTFYTMATDRTWDIFDGMANNLMHGFTKADELWSNMQENLMVLINSNNGTANYYAQHNYIARPNWADVERYLRKEITFYELKLALGC